MKCLSCNFDNTEGMKFCGKCGAALNKSKDAERLERKSHDSIIYTLPSECSTTSIIPTKGERKHVTVLFSDLSGYTAMCDKLDPEEAKDIMSGIFEKIAVIICSYEGFIEKYIGDAVVAIFGVPTAHEDDPVRAINAALKIHSLVNSLSPQIEKKTEKPLSMHTGINTGLVITGEINLDKGTHGLSGDTINQAARLSGLAVSGEILIGPDTYRRVTGYFFLKDIGPIKIKGKSGVINAYKVLSHRDEPKKIHRLHGLKANLVGRKMEMNRLHDAVENLRKGKGSIISISGDAGTGKSRLIEEFKSYLDLSEIQWREGHSYSYTQNTSYFPMIDLINRTYQIDEGEPLEKVREKVESGIERLIGRRKDVIPYIGSLLSLDYPEVEGMSPDSWKFQVQRAIETVLLALVQRGPTIVCLEDIHWADPSSLDLLRFILSDLSHAAIFLCAYRPPFSLFTSHQHRTKGLDYREIQLKDLSPSEAQDMAESLLKTQKIPTKIRQFIQEKVEGNPFYIEEVINFLIETETLVHDKGSWDLVGSINQFEISPTIHGVISARLDRLESETKRILQEASVIGRAFFYEILYTVTGLKAFVDSSLIILERLDMIRTKSLQPELEYIFKHALTQEVVYNGLLIKEREKVHERIALVMEQLFAERLPEIYETLAFHFEKGKSLHKAVYYHMKSGEKSLERYALEESNNFFNQAFKLLDEKQDKTKEENELLIDILIKWAFVFLWRGSFSSLIGLLKLHEKLAISLVDKAKKGMFNALLGLAFQGREELREAYEYLSKALKLGEEVRDHKVMGYACAWLSMTCADLGLFEKALVFGKRAQNESRLFESDRTLYLISLRAMAYTSWLRGDCRRTKEIGSVFLDYGQTHSDTRSTALGYMYLGMGNYISGDISLSIEFCKNAIQVSVDPIFSTGIKIMLGMSYVLNDQWRDAEKTFDEVIKFSEDVGSEFIGTAAQGFRSIVLLARGRLGAGVELAENVLRVFEEKSSKVRLAGSHYFIGSVFLKMVQRKKPKNLGFILKNIGFLLKNLFFFTKKSDYHFKKAIDIAGEIGANYYLGQAYFGLGLLYKAIGKIELSRKCISEAIKVFGRSEADYFLKNAQDVFESLKD